jgi:hypothetical protein
MTPASDPPLPGENDKITVGAKVPRLWHEQLGYLARRRGVNVSDILAEWIGCGLGHADLSGFRPRREVNRDPSSKRRPRRERRQ